MVRIPLASKYLLLVAASAASLEAVLIIEPSPTRLIGRWSLAPIGWNQRVHRFVQVRMHCSITLIEQLGRHQSLLESAEPWRNPSKWVIQSSNQISNCFALTIDFDYVASFCFYCSWASSSISSLALQLPSTIQRSSPLFGLLLLLIMNWLSAARQRH